MFEDRSNGCSTVLFQCDTFLQLSRSAEVVLVTTTEEEFDVVTRNMMRVGPVERAVSGLAGRRRTLAVL